GRVSLELQPDRALSEQRFDLIKGVHRHCTCLGDMPLARCERIAIVVSFDNKSCAVASYPLDLGGRGDTRQEDRCRDTEALRGIGDGDTVISAGRRNDSRTGHLAMQEIGESATCLEGP